MAETTVAEGSVWKFKGVSRILRLQDFYTKQERVTEAGMVEFCCEQKLLIPRAGRGGTNCWPGAGC